MPQQSCPWCSHCGPRYYEGTPASEIPTAHSDGSSCVCRHITTPSRASALEAHGRYFDRVVGAWRCFGCGTAKRIALDDVRRART